VVFGNLGDSNIEDASSSIKILKGEDKMAKNLTWAGGETTNTSSLYEENREKDRWRRYFLFFLYPVLLHYSEAETEYGEVIGWPQYQRN